MKQKRSISLSAVISYDETAKCYLAHCRTHVMMFFLPIFVVTAILTLTAVSAAQSTSDGPPLSFPRNASVAFSSLHADGSGVRLTFSVRGLDMFPSKVTVLFDSHGLPATPEIQKPYAQLIRAAKHRAIEQIIQAFQEQVPEG